MRDINRIDPFLKELGDVWKESPDLRFGQMIEGFKLRLGCDDLFYVEDEEFIRRFQKNNKKVTLNEFRYTPFVSDDTIDEHCEDLVKCEKLINKLLNGFSNYNGIDFCDVGANGIQVRIHHKQIKGYTYGNQITIKYDFSNIDEVPYQVVKEFIDNDTQDKVNAQKEFIEFGEKYGWD